MQNSIKKSFAVQLAEANNTVEAKGLVLSRWDKSITKGDVNRFKKLCEFGGFWYSLGQILVQLRTESGGSRTDSALLKNAWYEIFDLPHERPLERGGQNRQPKG